MKKILNFYFTNVEASSTGFRMSMDLFTSVLPFPPQTSYCSCTYYNMLFTPYRSGIPMTNWLTIKQGAESWIGIFLKNSVKMMQFQPEFEIFFFRPSFEDEEFMAISSSSGNSINICNIGLSRFNECYTLIRPNNGCFIVM